MMSRRVVILGAGESGTGAAILAKKQGFDLFVSDGSAIKPHYRELLEQHGIAFEELTHTRELILNADEVIKSPGIPDAAPIMQEILAREIPVLSEIEFGARYTNAKMVCITGSNGKTTTTMLIYHLLKQAGFKVGLAGNVGCSLALQVATTECDYYVVELSSFQLDNMYHFRANVAILLNITPDHLDRYDYKMENYVNSKFRIAQNQQAEDHFIYWSGDPILKVQVANRTFGAKLLPFSLEKVEGSVAYTEAGFVRVAMGEESFEMPLSELSLTGTHNLYNAMAAAITGKVLQLPNVKIRQALSTFAGVEHRLERVATIGGVEYINDSKATNVNSCWYALQSMTKPTVLIIGGVDKGNDYVEIEELVRDKVHTLLYIGVDNRKLHQFFDRLGKPSFEVESMEQAVSIAKAFAKIGDVVLLSPCCASFDRFKNYEDRGEQFKKQVNQLQ